MANLEQNRLERIMTTIREQLGLKLHHTNAVDALYDLKKIYEAQLKSHNTPENENRLHELEFIIQDLERKA